MKPFVRNWRCRCCSGIDVPRVVNMVVDVTDDGAVANPMVVAGSIMVIIVVNMIRTTMTRVEETNTCFMAFLLLLRISSLLVMMWTLVLA